MVPVFDHPTACDHDIADGRVAACEQHMVQCGVRRRAHHGWMRGIQHQPVRATPHLDRSCRLANGLRTVLRGITPKASAHVRLGGPRQHSAALLAQALLVFQPAQFLGRIDGGLTVGADTETAAGLEETGRVEEPVA